MNTKGLGQDFKVIWSSFAWSTWICFLNQVIYIISSATYSLYVLIVFCLQNTYDTFTVWKSHNFFLIILILVFICVILNKSCVKLMLTMQRIHRKCQLAKWEACFSANKDIKGQFWSMNRMEQPQRVHFFRASSIFYSKQIGFGSESRPIK